MGWGWEGALPATREAQLGKRVIANRRAQWKEIRGMTYQLLLLFASRFFELQVTNF